MSRQAFEKLLEHLSPPDRQRILRLAAEYGISLEDPAWMGLALTERGVIALEARLAELQAAETQRRHHWQTAEQDLIERLRTLVTEILVEGRQALSLEAIAARQEILKSLTQTVDETARAVTTAAAQRDRLRWLAILLGLALSMITLALGLGWWLGQRHAVAVLTAELPAAVAWAKDFDTLEKRQRALWALSDNGAWVYELAQLNQDFASWKRCRFGNDVGYLERQGDYTICYPASPKTRAVAGVAIAREAGSRP
jgi:hypothetical protein